VPLGEGPGNIGPCSEFAALICTLESLKVSQCPVFPILYAVVFVSHFSLAPTKFSAARWSCPASSVPGMPGTTSFKQFQRAAFKLIPCNRITLSRDPYTKRDFEGQNALLNIFCKMFILYKGQLHTVVRQAVLSKNHVVLAVLRFRSHGKGRGLLHVTCGNHIRKLVFL
jgi:hypothetical protein